MNENLAQMQIGDKRSYDDWGVYLRRGWTLTSPQVKKTFLNLPAADGQLDLTEVLVGEPRFADRDLRWEFIFTQERDQWDNLRAEILNECHGQRKRIYLPGYDDRYLEGRISCGDLSYERGHAILPISAVCSPFFNIDFNQRYTVPDFVETTIEGGRQTVTPEIETTGAVRITINGTTVELRSAGVHRPPELVLTQGSNRVRIENLADFGLTGNTHIDPQLFPATTTLPANNAQFVLTGLFWTQLTARWRVRARFRTSLRPGINGPVFANFLNSRNPRTAFLFVHRVEQSNPLVSHLRLSAAGAAQIPIVVATALNTGIHEVEFTRNSAQAMDGFIRLNDNGLGVLPPVGQTGGAGGAEEFRLFAFNGTGAGPTNWAALGGTIFDIAVWAGNNLFMDLVPVFRGSTRFSSTPAPSNCFWCRVRQRYFQNNNPNAPADLTPDVTFTPQVTIRFQDGSL